MRLLMMGTGSFAEPSFSALLRSRHETVGLVTQPDRLVGKERASTRKAARSLKDIAIERGLPVIQPDSINTPEGVCDIKALAPDLLVVAAYGQILSKDILATTLHGGINVHASLLPKYRGAAPINWAIYHGETETGVSIIRMSISLDAGDILAQEALAIGAEETAGELEARLAPLGAELALRVIAQLEMGPVAGNKQDKSLATKAPKLTKEHGLIDWNRSAKDVCNHIRAMQPWPTPYTFLHRPGLPPLRLIVQRATVAQKPTGAEVKDAGSVDVASGRLFVNVARAEVVEILELQPAGKNRMTSEQFQRGVQLPPTSSMKVVESTTR